jgi:hypothetical protein
MHTGHGSVDGATGFNAPVDILRHRRQLANVMVFIASVDPSAIRGRRGSRRTSAGSPESSRFRYCGHVAAVRQSDLRQSFRRVRVARFVGGLA